LIRFIQGVQGEEYDTFAIISTPQTVNCKNIINNSFTDTF